MKKLALFMALALMACACQPRLIILHTNDTHSHFEPVNGGERNGCGGCIERAAFIDSVRAAEGADRVLLLHAGDFSQGSSYFSELKGELEPRIINDLGYDCVTLGNHEFDNDIEALCERVKKLESTDVICANLDLSSFELGEYVKPYTVIEKGGMKVGIIGLLPDISTRVSKTVSSRLPAIDPVEAVNRWEEYLHKTEKCDLIILLSHQGYKPDQEIAGKTRWVDLVIGGHSHTFVDGFVYVRNLRHRRVPIVTDGCWGLEMGKVCVY